MFSSDRDWFVCPFIIFTLAGNTKVDMFVQFLTIKLLLVVTKQEIFLVY